MEKKILLAVDGSSKGFETVSAVGRLLKDSSDTRLVLFHCVQQLARLSPGELCIEDSCRLPQTTQEKVGTTIISEAQKRLEAAGFPSGRIEAKLKVDSIDPAHDILVEAEKQGIRTIAMGRRGRSQMEALLLGSVSSKVAQYATDRAVWVVDPPINETQRVLIALEGTPDSHALADYTASMIASSPQMEFTILHLIPPVPPTFWDDGHILGPAEQKDREARIEKWRADWTTRIEKCMDEARGLLRRHSVPDQNIKTLILPTREGIARDLLNEIDAHQFQIVFMGKKSQNERKPFLMGSHASKVLQSVKGTILCLIDAK